MISKKGRYYMVKFTWKGKVIRNSSRATDAKTARAVEGKLRSELARGNWGILEAKPRMTLGEFLKEDLLPYMVVIKKLTRKVRSIWEGSNCNAI